MSLAPLFSTEAEQTVLGALLLDNAALQSVESTGLTAQDFHDTGHRSLFAEMQKMIASGATADVITVFERLKELGKNEEWAGLAYLNGLTHAAPSSNAAARHAPIIKERALRRALVDAASGGASMAEAIASIEAIRARHEGSSGRSIDLLDVGSMLDDEPAELDFVLPGLLAGTVGMLVSAGATGKTMLAHQLAVLVACGLDTLHLEGRFELGRVVYLTAEDPAPVLHRRLHAIGQHITNAQQRQLLQQNFQIGDLIGRGADLLDQSWLTSFKRLVTGARLVVFDTTRRFHAGDENDSGEMAQLLSALERLCREAGTTILCLHHTSKSGAREGAAEQQAARGSSVLTDNARLQINLAGMTEAEAKTFQVDEAMRRSFVRLIYPKVNYAAAPADRWLRRGPGGVLTPAHLGRAGVTATGQPLPGAEPKDSVRRGGVVMAGGEANDDWK